METRGRQDAGTRRQDRSFSPSPCPRVSPSPQCSASQQLCPRARRIVRLVIFEQRSQREVAQLLGTSQTQIHRELAEALDTLRRAGPLVIDAENF